MPAKTQANHTACAANTAPPDASENTNKPPRVARQKKTPNPIQRARRLTPTKAKTKMSNEKNQFPM
jgi:hypothetical protein